MRGPSRGGFGQRSASRPFRTSKSYPSSAPYNLLQTTGASIDAIAGQVGYGDGITLRVLLREKTGPGVKDAPAGLRSDRLSRDRPRPGAMLTSQFNVA